LKEKKIIANLLTVLCKVDGKFEYEKRIRYYEGDCLTDEEIAVLNANENVYDWDLKSSMPVSETEAYKQALENLRIKNCNEVNALHEWLKNNN